MVSQGHRSRADEFWISLAFNSQSDDPAVLALSSCESYGAALTSLVESPVGKEVFTFSTFITV
jgi:hypothetical protein